MDEELIELVRTHEELYNSENKRYSDSIHKNQVWKEFGEQLNIDPEYCKKRWESLRSQYRKICRMRNSKSGQSGKSKKKWKYDDELSFLVPYMKDKARLPLTDGNISTEESVEDDVAADSAQAYGAYYSEDTLSVSLQEPKPTTHAIRKRLYDEHTEKLKNNTAVENAGATLLKYILDRKAAEESHPKDALDHFFEGIKLSVKEFSPQDQHMAKIKIFNIVSEMEAKYVNLENNSETIQ